MCAHYNKEEIRLFPLNLAIVLTKCAEAESQIPSITLKLKRSPLLFYWLCSNGDVVIVEKWSLDMFQWIILLVFIHHTHKLITGLHSSKSTSFLWLIILRFSLGLLYGSLPQPREPTANIQRAANLIIIISTIINYLDSFCEALKICYSLNMFALSMDKSQHDKRKYTKEDL